MQVILLACLEVLLLESQALLFQKILTMPIYEFYSPGTRKIYSFFARSLSHADAIPVCPDGKKYEMKKMISGFSITGRNAVDPEPVENIPNPDDPFSGMEQGQTDKVMQELEGALDGMDDDNPDPKQMGSLMRKMCEMTGERMDEPMEEVVRKLEEGMDPDELEDRMGDVLGDEGADGEIEQGEGEGSEVKARLRNLMRNTLVRDPELYEFSDYLPS